MENSLYLIINLKNYIWEAIMFDQAFERIFLKFEITFQKNAFGSYFFNAS